mgnify:FL=1
MLYIPTRTDIESLTTGDLALSCFGDKAKIVGEVVRGKDINGKIFAFYYTRMGDNARCSMSMKEDQLVRHVGTGKYFSSWQLDLIEANMLTNGERVREL